MTGAFAESFENLDKPVIAGFEILGVLGSGGHSKVYRARAQSGREVAIKRWLHPELGLDPGRDQARRMRREAKALKRLDHPGLCRFRGLVRDAGGRPCLVMDLVEGPSLLAEIEEQGPASAERAIALGIGLCEALEHLHQRGLVHRDVKPANVIIRRDDGRPVLVDLSIVQLGPQASSSQRLTRTGQMVGTAPYMAPEQCGAEVEGSELATDPRTDVYGLGALLFHALTGRPPWRNESPWERLERNPWERPHPSDSEARAAIAKARAGCPEALGAVVARCLEGEAKRRFPNTAALKAALIGCRDGASPRRLWPMPAALASLAFLGLGLFLKGESPISAAAPIPSQTRNDPVGEETSMKKTAGIAAVTTALALTTAAQAGPIETEPYTPIKEGYSWRYKVFGRKSGARVEIGAAVKEILGQRKRGGRADAIEIFRVRIKDPKGGPDQAFPPMRRFLSRDARGAIAIQDDGQETTEILLPKVLDKDQVWEPQGPGKGFATFDGFVDVEACGKMYRRCLKVTTLSSFGGKGPSKAVIYYARGVGMVSMRRDKAVFELSAFEKQAREPRADEVIAAARDAFVGRQAGAILTKGTGARLEEARVDLLALERPSSKGRVDAGWRFELGFRGRFRGAALTALLTGRVLVELVRDEDGRFAAAILECPAVERIGQGGQGAPSLAEAEACLRAYFKGAIDRRVRAITLAGLADAGRYERENLPIFLRRMRFSGALTSITAKGPQGRLGKAWVFELEGILDLEVAVQGAGPQRKLMSFKGPAALARGESGAWVVVEDDLRAPIEPMRVTKPFVHTLDMDKKR